MSPGRASVIAVAGVVAIAGGFVVGRAIAGDGGTAVFASEPTVITTSGARARIPTLAEAKNLPALKLAPPPPVEVVAETSTTPTEEIVPYSPPVTPEPAPTPSPPAVTTAPSE